MVIGTSLELYDKEEVERDTWCVMKSFTMFVTYALSLEDEQKFAK